MEEQPFICPYCETELTLPDHVWYYTCDHCGKRLDLMSQFAYLRGLDAFDEGQEIVKKTNPKKRRNKSYHKNRVALNLFMQAYSSLQVAFQSELEGFQRALSVEMMASMVQEFIKQGMVSPLEANYWNTLMVEQTAQREYDQLKEKLRTSDGLLGFLKRWRWKMRQERLVKSLEQLDRKVKSLEDHIEFVDVPRARNKKWKP